MERLFETCKWNGFLVGFCRIAGHLPVFFGSCVRMDHFMFRGVILAVENIAEFLHWKEQYYRGMYFEKIENCCIENQFSCGVTYMQCMSGNVRYMLSKIHAGKQDSIPLIRFHGQFKAA